MNRPLLAALFLEVELFEFFFGEFCDAGGGDETVLVLGSDELDVSQVGRFLDALLLGLVVAESESDLDDGQVVQRDGRRRHRDHHRLGHVRVDLVQRG